mgnify:CR=1 FL=1
MSKMCQSCGMPHSKDPGGGGTNADGTRNANYCSYCYQDGAFTQPDFDVAQMQAFCIEMMQKQGMWKPMAWLLTRGLPRLDRWRA